MTFCDDASASSAAAAAAPSVVDAGGGAGAACGSVGFVGDGATVPVRDSRMREIGGSTVVFFLISPSAAFFCGCFLSINETLSAAGRDGVAGFGAGFAGAAV